ncbi:MAG: glycosyltransferase [Lachnospiraceae bacterium]|nr:glycosyltransferase [Lachnospiraceae bacterium]
MQDKNLISIVLPVYNGEKYLVEAIESILGQTYSSFELIVVNDCSTDMTEKIIREYMERDNRISVISNETNQKLPRSLNIGFRVAKGNYLTWTSDDNRYHADALEKMLSFLKSKPDYAMVYSDMILIDKDGKKIGNRTSSEGDYYKYNCIGASFLYKSECRDVVGEYNAELFLVEDYEYWLRIAKRYKIGHIDEFLYDYRFHGKSLSFSKMKEVGHKVAYLKTEYISDICKSISTKDLLPILFEIAVYSEDKLDSKVQALIDSVNEDISWFIDRNKTIDDNKVWLFGAGAIGIQALNYIGKDRVEGFIDNDPGKKGIRIEDKLIISFDDYIKLFSREKIVISVDVRMAYFVALQLRKQNITDYSVFYDLLLD